MTAVATATEIRMPRLSDSMTEGTIISWLVQDGETVAADDEIVEIETDKATMAYATEARRDTPTACRGRCERPRGGADRHVGIG